MRFNTTAHQHRIQLNDIVKGNSAAKTPKWRSTIKQALLLKINQEPVTCEADVKHIIETCRTNKDMNITCTFATVQQHGIHPTKGSLMLFYDQLNVNAKHLTNNDTDDGKIHHIS
jgi:glycosylphosphatidylinositol transamidase (GPIT) subunit GPI8